MIESVENTIRHMNDVPKCWRKKNRTKQSAKKRVVRRKWNCLFFSLSFLAFLKQVYSVGIWVEISICCVWLQHIGSLVYNVVFLCGFALLPACNVAFNCCRIFFFACTLFGLLECTIFFPSFSCSFCFFLISFYSYVLFIHFWFSHNRTS